MKATILKKLVNERTIYHSNFISFEGGEGSGKSTVLQAVYKRLQENGYDVFATREPGGNGSEKSEAIRKVIFQDKMHDMEPLTEGFLYAAARTQHIKELVLPKLVAGTIVLTDRFVDSSLVYQGLQWEENLEKIVTLNHIAIQNTMPKQTLFFDIPAAAGLERVFQHRQDEMNYLDKRGIEFHERIYDNFKLLASIFPERYIFIDATAPLEVVIDNVYQIVLQIITQ